MARTVASIIAAARHNINDEDGADYRISDDKFLTFVQDGVDEAVSVRPDLLIGNFPNGFTDLTSGSPIPFAGRDAIALTYYVTARAEMADDEHVDSNRMTQALTQFRGMLLGAA